MSFHVFIMVKNTDTNITVPKSLCKSLFPQEKFIEENYVIERYEYFEDYLIDSTKSTFMELVTIYSHQ